MSIEDDELCLKGSSVDEIEFLLQCKDTMKQLYSNKKELNFNGKSMYLKLFIDKRDQDSNFDLAFNQGLHEKGPRARKAHNIYWENLPNNVI